jgi:signal transduction histidine kinase
LKIRTIHNEIKYIFIKGKVFSYSNHVPFKIMGITWDITDRKRYELELQSKNRELEEKNIQLGKIQEDLTLINNELERRVEERTRQLSMINIELNREIGERKKIEEALKQKNEELEKINSDLDNFVYSASHDLKAPISNIEGLIKALPFEIKDASEEERIILSLINESIQKFKETLQDLAEIARAQKKDEEDIALIDLHELIEEIKLSIKDMIEATHAKFFYEGCDFPQVKFSKANMKSILFNLISNAIKYRHPEREPEIRIGCEGSEGNVLLWVKDNKLGINPSHHQKIFTMFKRLHNHVEGTGIGLYLVKRIIDNCNGTIEIESEEGVGSMFKIKLTVDN